MTYSIFYAPVLLTFSHGTIKSCVTVSIGIDILKTSPLSGVVLIINDDSEIHNIKLKTATIFAVNSCTI